MAMETRFIKAEVRAIGAIGQFEAKIFELNMTVTGGYWDMCEMAFAAIRAQGFEPHHIISHSTKRL